jgi:hypothetical protein
MSVRQHAASAAAAAVCATSLAGAAWACGDKLVALGGGVGFERVMVSRYPGHIVLWLEPAGGLAAANERFNFAASLSLAGHEVFIVESADDMRALSGQKAPDLILMDAERAKQLQFQATAVGAGPMIMPVVYPTDRGEAEVAEHQTGCVTVAGGRKGSQLLRAVEKALKLRSRGLPMTCEKGAESQQA